MKKATSLKNMITGASQMDGAILVVSHDAMFNKKIGTDQWFLCY